MHSIFGGDGKLMQEDEDESMLDETFVDDNDMHDIIHVSNLFENKGRSKGGSDRQLISTCLRLVALVYRFPWYLQYNGNSHC